MDKPDLALAFEKAPKKGPPRAALDDMSEEADESVEPSDEETDPALSDAASAVRMAFKSGDDEEFAKTLKGFIKLCGEY